MPTKVLVFESDPAFAGELRTELSRLGLVAQVVDDGNAGLMAAALDRPDLILLSIELPRMNGFSVCNKLKKDPALKDVPLIIMSSESSDETFEQHRKLRTRAEDYVHKPIAFGELLEHIRPYVALENGGGPVSMSPDSAILIDDEIEVDDLGEVEALGELDSEAEARHQAGIDAEVEAFANNAFDHLMDEGNPPPSAAAVIHAEAPGADMPLLLNESPLEDVGAQPSGHEVPSSAVRRSTTPPRPKFDAEVDRLRGELERQKSESARLEREFAASRAEVQRLEEVALQDSGSNDQVMRLQRELDELRQKAPVGVKVGGVSSREFLDLREALNKKDKEILSLKDQISRKEKELLDASDTALSMERDKADQDDKIAALEKEVQSARSGAETAKADKDQAAKRAEDFKARGEKTKAELEAKIVELSGIHRKHEDELALRESAMAALRETHRQELRGEVEARETAVRAAQQAADDKLGAAVTEARDAEQRARYEAVSKLKEELESERRGHEEALMHTKAEAEADKEIAIRVREAELQIESQQEQNRLRADLTQAVADNQGEKARWADRERELEAQRMSELVAQRVELEGKGEAQRVELESKLETQRTEFETRRGELETTRETQRVELEKLEAQRAELEATRETQRIELEGKLEAQRVELEYKLEAQRADYEARLETQKADLEGRLVQLEFRASELAADLSIRTDERETFSREVSQQKEKLGRLESELADAKAELAGTRDKLSTQTQKLDAATSKWHLNRTSLEQAKDAIAAAVAQIEEAETRGLD